MSIVKPSVIWEELLDFDKWGGVVWRSGEGHHEGAFKYQRPLEYVAIYNGPLTLNLTGHNFQYGNLVLDRGKSYVASNGESTGVDGQLRLLQNFGYFPDKQPDNLLIVGAFGHTILYYVLQWLHDNGWNETPVTLVDKSRIPLDFIESLRRHGFWKWDAGVKLVHSDIRSYLPLNGARYDVALMDIVNVYAVDEMFHTLDYPGTDDPFLTYRQILQSCQGLLTEDGVLFSRTLSRDAHNPQNWVLADKEEIERRIQALRTKLGDELFSRIYEDDMIKSVSWLWWRPHQKYHCGLTTLPGYMDRYGAKFPLQDDAPEKLRRLYHEIFGEQKTEEVVVYDPTRKWTFQTFANKIE